MYAEVAVNSPVVRRQTFSYSVPPGMNITVGQAVWVPFGPRVLQGLVLELAPVPAVPETREVAGLIQEEPVLSPVQLKLARWLSEYYLAPLFSSLSLMLPPGFERKSLTYLSPPPDLAERDLSSLTPEARQVLDLLRPGETPLTKLEKALGKKKTLALVSYLVGRGLAVRHYRLAPLRVKVKKEPYLRLLISPLQAREEVNRLKAKARKQAALLDFLASQTRPVPLAEARQRVDTNLAVARALTAKGWLAIEEVAIRRDPISYEGITPSQPLLPTMAQQNALEAIKSRLGESDGRPSVFLLHGVTGSGKTEVYLQALADTIKRGKRGIVLVPEISLTPQTIERFASRFPHRVALLHSRLSLGEQFDEWHCIRAGEFDVVIGPRSALFAPQPDLGLIVMDEEHEWSYKQQDQPPLYHTREAAVKLAELTGAVVVLGSATPDVESFYRAQRGDYRLLTLPERVTPTEGASLPRVEVVDLREELKAGNTGIFSRSLSEALAQTVSQREQAILFLNRRGGASFLQCRRCGYVFRCRRCGSSLAQHPAERSLVCHLCNYRTALPQTCPRCASPRLKFLGAGTQKVEQEAGYFLPQARLLRWDSDVTRQKHSHRDILERFRSHQADILIGTQMVAKGLDLPRVTLVGVVNADTALFLPDFRAGERTFQLLSQVAGRAGRGPAGGKVIIQTYSPEHY
ncbi:MAG: primosomal protein N', partial [Chloroflexota bacterium]